jgi:release factor glutamine methyltransferase
MTIADIIQRYKSTLIKVYDSAEARTIITMILKKELQLNALRLEMNKYLLLTTHQQEVLEKHLERLLNHEPVQYILGEADFMDMKLNVNPHVLIPRPETEDLVRWIVETVGKDFSGSILDIGTGSGCIAVALKKLLPAAEVSACDICSNALYTATENAIRNETEINFFRLDVLMENLPLVSDILPLPPPEGDKTARSSQYDIIVSNPPYIPLNEKATLAKHVADFEPAQALFTPASEALIFYERIATLATRHLNKDGKLFFETHTDKTTEVADLLHAKGFKNVEVRKDVFEKNRMVKGTWSDLGQTV